VGEWVWCGFGLGGGCGGVVILPRMWAIACRTAAARRAVDDVLMLGVRAGEESGHEGTRGVVRQGSPEAERCGGSRSSSTRMRDWGGGTPKVLWW